MKKFLLFMMVLISLNTYAQNVQLGFTGGISAANYRSRVDGKTESGKTKGGLTIGVVADIPAGKHFSFQPAINFVQKGTKDEQSIGSYTEKVRINVNCLELPLNILYNTRGKNGNVFVGAGPSFAIAVSGKGKYDDGTIKESVNLKFGSGDEDFLRPIDLGANFTAGFSLPNGILFSVNYNTGLNNLFPNGSNDGKLRSNYFGIKVGYMLRQMGKKKKML